jgi:hypothetical protein
VRFVRTLAACAAALLAGACSEHGSESKATLPSAPILQFEARAGTPPSVVVEPPAELAGSLEAAEAQLLPALLGGERRMARALRPGRRFVARGRASSDTCVLALGAGAAEVARGDAAGLALDVRVRSGDGVPRGERFELSKRGEWFDFRVPLGLRAGDAFELELELACPHRSYAVAVVAEPTLFTPQS